MHGFMAQTLKQETARKCLRLGKRRQQHCLGFATLTQTQQRKGNR